MFGHKDNWIELKKMKAIGIVFLFDKKVGSPEDISKQFSKYFSNVSENFVKEGLMDLVELKSILDSKKIFWGGIKEDFENLLKNDELIGDLAWNVFKKHVNIEAAEDIRTLIYQASDAPWGFTLIANVLYEE